MKKFLSLVLALVMTMSLVTISAGAKDFTDASKIQYNEAIDVISAVKVVDGYADGSFNPQATLTRGAAAKIICNLILGPTTAVSLVADAAPYKDVPADSTFAGYIAFCQKEGIISGYADGTFRPGNTLTGYAFMKMLLGALGYDASVEGYTGANWSINVAKRALNIGLDSGLVDNFNGTKPVTREEACLYAFNTLKATMVEYDSKTNISIGGAEVVIAGSKAKSQTWINNEGKNYKTGLASAADETKEFCEVYFKNLHLGDDGKDEFGRPSNTWYVKAEKVGEYVKAPKVSYSKDVKLSDIYADLGMSAADTTASVYVNDETACDTVTVSKSNPTKVSDACTHSDITGNGTIIDVYRNDNNHVDICVISVYAGEITKVVDATKTKDAHVVVNELGGVVCADDTFETTDFEEDDIVAFTYSNGKIQTMYKMESVEGTLTTNTLSKSVTIGENTIKLAEEVAYEGTLTQATMNTKSDYQVFVDENGYALYVKEVKHVVEDYALVDNIRSTGAWQDNEAKLIFADGTKKTVKLEKDYYDNNNSNGNMVADIGDIVTYKVNSDGTYRLNAVSTDVARATDGTFETKNGSSKVVTAAGSKYADEKTVFVVYDTTADSYTVYTGASKVPTISTDPATTVAYNVKNGVLEIVFVAAAGNKIEAAADSVVYFAGKSVSKETIDSDNNHFYVYNAVVNGEITTVKVLKTASNVVSVGDSSTNYLYKSASFNSDNFVSSVVKYATEVGSSAYNAADTYTITDTGVKKMDGKTTIQLNTVVWSVAKDAKFFLVDGDGVITEVALSSIKTDSNNTYTGLVKDGKLTTLFVQEVTGG